MPETKPPRELMMEAFRAMFAARNQWDAGQEADARESMKTAKAALTKLLKTKGASE